MYTKKYKEYEVIDVPNITVTGIDYSPTKYLPCTPNVNDVSEDDVFFDDASSPFISKNKNRPRGDSMSYDIFKYAPKKTLIEIKKAETKVSRSKYIREEISKYLKEETTFLVLASRLGKVYVYRFNKAKSLWVFGATNPIRKVIIYLITNQIFEFFVILTILVNCVFLALNDAPEEAEYVFTAIYTTEMMLKIVAKGFVLHRFAYLRDPWNWLDFVVVVLGYITLAPGMVINFSGIRTFRVLRALRTISAIEGLKTMVNALLKSMRMLSDVLILTSFFICVFALVGLQLFSGHFHNRCVANNIIVEPNMTWTDGLKNSTNWFKRFHSCGNNSGSLHCPENYTCHKDIGPNPNYGFTSYDDFGWALLTSFQLVTLDYWEQVYFIIASTLGPWHVFYFMIVIFFGSFYLINLVLAVVAVSYQQETAHNADLESQYEFLREIAASYSLHRRILPKLLFDDPTIDNISNLPCVKKGPSVIILSSTNSKNAKPQSKTIALGRVFHSSKSTIAASPAPSNQEEHVKDKLASIINRVKMDRVKDRLKSENTLQTATSSNTNSPNTTPRRKLNIANVKSMGKTLHVPTTGMLNNNNMLGSRNSSSSSSIDSSRKQSFAARVTSKINLQPENEVPLPYADLEDEDFVKCTIRFRRKVYFLVMTPWFELSVTIFILLNTICLALEYHGMDVNFKKALDVSNHVFTGIFILEMVLKLIAFGPVGYVKSKWNIFDGLVVILSIVDLFIEVIFTLEDNGDFTIIRSLRLFRVLKLAQSWATMRLLLSAIGRSLNALGNLTLILGIIVYMFAVVGTHVFGDKYKPERFPGREVPVWNFGNFGHSILLIFRVLCGEWIELLYEAMQATSVWAIAFFLPALVVGNFLVLNLFLALLLNSFADQAMEEELKKKSFMKSKLKWVSSTRKLAKIQSAFKSNKSISKIEPEAKSSEPLSLFKATTLLMQKKKAQLPPVIVKEPKISITSIKSIENGSITSNDMSSVNTKELVLGSDLSGISIKERKHDDVAINVASNVASNMASSNGWSKLFVTGDSKDKDTVPQGSTISDSLRQRAHLFVQSQASDLTNKPPTPSIVSNGAFQRNNGNTSSLNSTSAKTFHKLDPFCPMFFKCVSSEPTADLKCCCGSFRLKVKNLIENKWFENGILILIIASSFVLVFEDIHLSTKPKLVQALDILNVIFCFLFFVEFVLKVIGLGVYGYIKNPWNCLDFLIVLVSTISVVNGFLNTQSNLKTLRSLRTFRALRPLRAVSRWDGMKIVVNSLLKAIPSIGNVLLVCLMFWLIFSILGVQFFGGKFWKCVDINGIRFEATIIPNKSECLLQGYRWRNSHVNFDNALNGFLPLLQVATFEGWIEVMRDAVDATKIDQQPIKENNFAAYFYFVVFIIVGSFFILNLFISVIIDNFYRLKKQYDDCGTVELFLTNDQKKWFSTVKKALTKKPKRIINRPKSYYHGQLFDFVLSPKFETITMMLIFINIILMMFQHYQQSDNVSRMLRIVNLVFTVLFTIELAIRIVALRLQYFLDRWNIFDFIIVVFSLVGIVLEYMNVVLHVTPSVLRVARVLRIGRLLRYFNSAKGIRRLLVALVISLPALFNIGALLFLVLFIYSIIGMSNFGYVKKQGAINEISNFETFGNSMLLLFRLATSAGWNEVLDSLMISPPDCDPDFNNVPNGNCGTALIAVIFFVTYILITFLIIVNMYIAVILENFNQAHEQDEIGITDEDIEMFYAVWQLYDPFATQYIEFEKLQYLIANLGPPLGIPFPNKVAVHNLNLPMKEDDKIHCIDVLQALLKRVLGNIGNTDTEHYDNMTKTIDKKLRAAFPIRLKDTTKTTTMDRLKEIKAASIIQKYFRDYKKRADKKNDFLNMHLNDFEHDINAYALKNSMETVFTQVMSKENEHSWKKPIKRLFSDSKICQRLQASPVIFNTPFKKRNKGACPSDTCLKCDNESYNHSPVKRSYSAHMPRFLSTHKSKKSRNHSTPVCVRSTSPQRKNMLCPTDLNEKLSSISMVSLEGNNDNNNNYKSTARTHLSANDVFQVSEKQTLNPLTIRAPDIDLGVEEYSNRPIITVDSLNILDQTSSVVNNKEVAIETNNTSVVVNDNYDNSDVKIVVVNNNYDNNDVKSDVKSDVKCNALKRVKTFDTTESSSVLTRDETRCQSALPRLSISSSNTNLASINLSSRNLASSNVASRNLSFLDLKVSSDDIETSYDLEIIKSLERPKTAHNIRTLHVSNQHDKLVTKPPHVFNTMACEYIKKTSLIQPPDEDELVKIVKSISDETLEGVRVLSAPSYFHDDNLST